MINYVLLRKWKRSNIISHENNKQKLHKHINQTKPRTTTSMREKGIDKYANAQCVHNTQATRCTSINVYTIHK